MKWDGVACCPRSVRPLILWVAATCPQQPLEQPAPASFVGSVVASFVQDQSSWTEYVFRAVSTEGQ